MRNHGRARVSSTNPRAFGLCDRCGFLYNHDDLQWQYDYAGPSLKNKRLLVCAPCLDTAQMQLRSIVLPADPMPVQNIRTQDYDDAEIDYRVTSAPSIVDPKTGIPIPQGSFLQTQDGRNIALNPIGTPNGLEQGAIMPVQEGLIYNQVVPVLSIIANGTDQISVSCSAPHNLVTNNQISVEDLSNNDANGFYSVTVTSTVTFTYQTFKIIPASSLLQPSTIIVSAIVGLPRGFTQIPLTG